MFHSSYFSFLVTFGDEVTKILRNLCLHFEWKMGKTENKQKVAGPSWWTQLQLSQPSRTSHAYFKSNN